MEIFYLLLGGLLSLVLCRFIKFPQKDPQVVRMQEQITELWNKLDRPQSESPADSTETQAQSALQKENE